MAVAGRAPSSIARAVSALRSFFRFLDSRGLARNAAIASVPAPPVPAPADVLVFVDVLVLVTAAQGSPELTFLDAAPPHWVAMTTSPPSPSK